MNAPEEMPPAFAEAWNARDPDALAALFAEDADFVNVVGIWWNDRQSIRKAHHYGLTTFFRESRLLQGKTKVRRMGEDAAVVHCRFSLSGQLAPDGTPAGQRTGILTFVMQRLQDRWLCVSAQNTDVVPNAETLLWTSNALEPRTYRP